jgi:hypothetical protein
MIRFPATQDQIDAVKQDRVAIAELREAVRQQFLSFFVDEKGGTSHPPGPIVPEHDKSVAFTGSTISTLKPILLSAKIPDNGIFMVQNCLRAQNTKILSDVSKSPQWSSLFSSTGGLANVQEMDPLLSKTWQFFTDRMGIPEDRLHIRIASTDTDLLESCRRTGLSSAFEVDANPPVYYTHKFGLPTVFGRNFNFAISDPKTRELRDIGNFIVIEDSGKPMALEIAFGVETIVSRALGMASPIHAAPITDFIPAKDGQTVKFADALSASTAILQADVRPTASDMRGRVLRQYLQGAGSLRASTGLEREQIRQAIDGFEQQEFGHISGASDKITRYIDTCEEMTRNGTSLSGKQNAALSEIFSGRAGPEDTMPVVRTAAEAPVSGGKIPSPTSRS